MTDDGIYEKRVRDPRRKKTVRRDDDAPKRRVSRMRQELRERETVEDVKWWQEEQ
jgi:hypothetical protein